MEKTRARPGRTLIVIMCIVAGLVVISLIVVFSRGTIPLRPASTPEGVVQRYSAAVIAGDEDAAIQYLVREVGDNCDRSIGNMAEDLRVTLISTESRADSADVNVSLITSNADRGPFGSSGYETEDVFDLVKEDGEWVVRSAPWPLTICVNEALR
ncbi:MAG TPA: hypothetical protein VEX88_00990 [Glaciibacter sp.]|nr:hypothetical protein [Glaciibacter sp.]